MCLAKVCIAVPSSVSNRGGGLLMGEISKNEVKVDVVERAMDALS